MNDDKAALHFEPYKAAFGWLFCWPHTDFPWLTIGNLLLQ